MKSASRDDTSSVDPVPPSQFIKGQRVMFYDNKGEKHYGTVGWTGKNTRTRAFDYTLVGIQTVSVCDQRHMGGERACNSFNGRITI